MTSSRLRPLRLALGAATAVALVVAVILASSTGRGSSSSQGGVTTGPESSFDGAALPGNITAPPFTLTDQAGERVSLASYRGRVVVLTFLYTTCGSTCEVIAQQIRGALGELEDERARPPAVVIVSADPAVDSRANVDRFLQQASLGGRAQYLTGPLSQLRSIWRAYRVRPASAGARVFDEYASVMLLDPAGRERVLFQSEQLTPESLSHDIRRLAGDPPDP
jgi:protein SCO1